MRILGADAFEHYWPQIEKALDEMPELWSEAHTKDTLYSQFMNGHLSVWTIEDESVVRAAMMMQRYVAPNGIAALQVFWMFGSGLHEALELVVSAIKKFAVEYNCARVEITGRKGFERLLRPFGVQYKYSVFSAPVVSERKN